MTGLVWHLHESNGPSIFFKHYWCYKLLDSVSFLKNSILFCMTILNVPSKMNNWYIYLMKSMGVDGSWDNCVCHCLLLVDPSSLDDLWIGSLPVFFPPIYYPVQSTIIALLLLPHEIETYYSWRFYKFNPKYHWRYFSFMETFYVKFAILLIC